jgi:hypothetical protein
MIFYFQKKWGSCKRPFLMFLFFLLFRLGFRQQRLPARPADRVRRVRGRLVGDGSARRKAGRAQEAAQRVPGG